MSRRWHWLRREWWKLLKLAGAARQLNRRHVSLMPSTSNTGWTITENVPLYQYFGRVPFEWKLSLLISHHACFQRSHHMQHMANARNSRLAFQDMGLIR